MIRLILFLLAFSTLFACRQAENKMVTDAEQTDTLAVVQPAETVTVTDLNYSSGGESFRTFYATPANKDKSHPIVLVIPEWWGLNDYIRYRVSKLASEGYVAMGVDMYANGFNTTDPKVAGERAGAFYQDIAPAINRFRAALAEAKKLPGADTSNVAVIGYCFGGAMALQMAYAGQPIDAAVSFHGNLPQQTPDKNKVTMPLLVLNGAADSFISEKDINTFRSGLDKINASYKFINYPGAKHAFTNPGADSVAAAQKMDIAYNAEADKASWAEMLSFYNAHLTAK